MVSKCILILKKKIDLITFFNFKIPFKIAIICLASKILDEPGVGWSYPYQS